MKIYVAGLPGSGKTTQANKLGEKLNLHVVRMGDILRNLSLEDTEQSRMIREIMNTGELLDDEIVAKIIKEEVEKEDYKDGFVMEGYPRTRKQIELFNPEFDKVIVLKVSLECLLERMIGRGRKDDSPQAIRVRLEEQLDGLKEVLRFYEQSSSSNEQSSSSNEQSSSSNEQSSSSNKDKTVEIDGEKSVDEVFESIVAHLN